MMQDDHQDDIDWSEDERRALNTFGADESPSEVLRSRTLKGLREQGLVGTARRGRRASSLLGIAAAATIAAGATAYFAIRSREASDHGQQLVDSVTAATRGTTRVERHIIWF